MMLGCWSSYSITISFLITSNNSWFFLLIIYSGRSQSKIYFKCGNLISEFIPDLEHYSECSYSQKRDYLEHLLENYLFPDYMNFLDVFYAKLI